MNAIDALFGDLKARGRRAFIPFLTAGDPDLAATPTLARALVEGGADLLEIGFPFLVWDRRLRWFMICGSITMHTFIALFMGLTTFSLMMMIMVLAFIPPETARLGVARLQDRVRKFLADRARPPLAPALSVTPAGSGDKVTR